MSVLNYFIDVLTVCRLCVSTGRVTPRPEEAAGDGESTGTRTALARSWQTEKGEFRRRTIRRIPDGITGDIRCEDRLRPSG